MIEKRFICTTCGAVHHYANHPDACQRCRRPRKFKVEISSAPPVAGRKLQPARRTN